MAIKPVQRSSTPNQAKPNLLDQISQAWKDVVSGKYRVPQPTAKKPNVKTTQPNAQNTPVSTNPNAKPKVRSDRRATETRATSVKPSTNRNVVKPAAAQPNPLQTAVDQTVRHGQSLAQQGLRHMSNTTVGNVQKMQRAGSKLGSALNDLRTGKLPTFGQKMSRNLQPDRLNSRLKSLGSVMSHSGMGGVAQVGQALTTTVQSVDSVKNAVKAAPKFFSDTRDLLTGKTPTSKRDVAAGTVSGSGNAFYGAGAGTLTTGASAAFPGFGSDLANHASAKVQQALDNKYRQKVEALGVNTKSKAYQSSRDLAQAVTTVVMATSGKIGSKFSPRLISGKPKVVIPSTPPSNLIKVIKLAGANNISRLTRKPVIPSTPPPNLIKVTTSGGVNNIKPFTRKPNNPSSSSPGSGGGGPTGTGGTHGSGRPGASGGVDASGGTSSRGGVRGGGNAATLQRSAQLTTPAPTLTTASNPTTTLAQNMRLGRGGQQVPFMRAKPLATVTLGGSNRTPGAPVSSIPVNIAPSAKVNAGAPVLNKPYVPAKPSNPTPGVTTATANRAVPVATGAVRPLSPNKPVYTSQTQTPTAVALKPQNTPTRTETSPAAKPTTPAKEQITQPIGAPARPLLPAATPQPQTAQPLGTPSSPTPNKRTTDKPQTTRPIGDPAPWFPKVAPVELDPTSKPQRRGIGDRPLKPEVSTPETKRAVEEWLKKQAAKNIQKRLEDYSSGRITREQATSGLSAEDRAKLNAALNQIDKMRVGGSSGSSSASGGNYTTAGVKDVWRQVDSKGGIDAMPESAVRQLKGITEQGLKNTDLSAMERAELMKRLEGVNKAQGQYHKAREADKNNPPVNPASWNLPMGKKVFGQQAAQPQWQPAGRNAAASASTSNALPNKANTASAASGSNVSQDPQIDLPSSVDASVPSTLASDGRSTKTRYWNLPSTLVETDSGLAVRVNDLKKNQKLQYDRLRSSELSKENINEILTLLSTGSVDDLAKKYSQLSANNLAGITMLRYGLEGNAAGHDITHTLIGDKKSIPFDASLRGEASGGALLNRFIGEPEGIYDGFSVTRDSNQKLILSTTPSAKKTALDAFDRPASSGKADGTRLSGRFNSFFNAESRREIFNDFSKSSTAVLDPRVWPSRFDFFYNLLSKSGHIPQKYDAALADSIRENYKKYEASASLPEESRLSKQSEAMEKTHIDLAQAATNEFKNISRENKLKFYADGIAAVLAMNSAYPTEVQKPSDTDFDRFRNEWVKLDTSANERFNKPGFLGDYLEIRNQVRSVLGVPVQSDQRSTTESQGQTTDSPSSTDASVPSTPSFENRSEKNKYEILPSTLVRTDSGLAVRVNDLAENQKQEYDRLTNSGLSEENINEIVNHLSLGSVDDLANKYSQLSADNLASVSLLLYGLEGPASVHDLSHSLIGDSKSMAFDASERGEASGHALLNDFIRSPNGIYDGFSVSRSADQKPVVSMAPGAAQKALDEFRSPAFGKSTRVDAAFSINFRGNSLGRSEQALKDSSAPDFNPKIWPSRFDAFYDSLAKSGQLPKKYDAALTEKLRESFSKYEAVTKTMNPAQIETEMERAALHEFSPILMRAARAEFDTLPKDKKLRFYADGIAAVLAINNASPMEVHKPRGTSPVRFNDEWIKLKTSESGAFTKPGFLKDYLEIRNQVRQMLGVPSESGQGGVK